MIERPDARERHPFWGDPENLAEAESWRLTVHQRLQDIDADLAVGKAGGPIRDDFGQPIARTPETYREWRAGRILKKKKVLSRYLWLNNWVKVEREMLGLPGRGARQINPGLDAMHAAARRFGVLEGFLAAFRVWLDLGEDDAPEDAELMAWRSLLDAYDRLEEPEAA